MHSLLPLCICFGLMVGISGVSRPPTLLEQPPKEAAYVLMEAMKLTCIADSDPPPKYSWFKNGKYFNPAANSGRYAIWPGQGTLIFANPHEDDDGLYQCIAENQYGKSLSVKTNLRRVDFSSFDGRANTLYLKRGSSKTLICGKPTSYPPPKVFWRYKNHSSTNNVIEDARHATNLNGDLVFASVQKEDNNVQYFCVISSEILGREERGFPYTIKVLNIDSNPDESLMLISNSPISNTALLNESMELFCNFGGNPVPSINWRFIDIHNVVKDVSTLPHVRFAASGVRLIIDRVMQVHQGAYQCVGSNPNSIDMIYRFTLAVKSSPYWVEKPTDAMQPPGATHTFKCKTHGDPKPTISWSVNGDQASKWIAAAPARRRIEGDELIITDLVTADTAVIQCNASNNFGYVFADAYINVVQEPPSFIKEMPALTYKAEGQSVVLLCKTYSAPAAIPTWTRVERNQQLTGGRYNILANSNLRINSLMVSDTGRYQCTATNVYGSVTTAGQLVVRRRTRITLAPHDVRVYERTDVKFVCAGSTDPLEVHKLRQEWLKDGVLIDLTKQTRVRVNPADNSLIIGGVRPMDTGSYTCVITNGIDQANASASLIVQGRPDQPNSVTVDCTTKKAERKAIVNWKAGADNSAPILKYEIEFAVEPRPFWFPADIVASEAVGGDGSSGTEEGGANPSAEVLMRPGLQYIFRVRARNIVGLSEPSTPGRTSCTTDPAPPNTNPTNLWAEGTLPNNIIVHWTPMSEFEQNAGGLEYQLTINCVDCTNMPSDAKNITYITNWRDTNLPFLNTIRADKTAYQIEKYKRYNVTIRSRNVIGFSTMATTIGSGFSGEGPPSVRVADVALKPGSGQNVGQNNQLTLEWTAPADINSTDAVNGFFRGYRIEWCHVGLSEEQCEATKRYEDYILHQPKHPLHMTYRRRRRRSVEEEVSRTKRATPARLSYTVTRLPGAARLRMWLRVLNKRNAGPPSNVVEVTTAEGTPGPVNDFSLRRKGVTHLSFGWSAPVQTNGNLSGYQMGVQMISGLDLGYLKRYPEITDSAALSGEVAGLKPRSTYRVYIWPRTTAGYGVSTFIDVQTSPANVAPGSPTIRIDSVTASSINVSFAPSQTGEPGSVFYIQFRLPGRNKWEESQREFSKRWLQLSDLPTDTSYQVRVVATNGAGLTSFSEMVWVTTSGQGPNKMAGASATWFIAVICLLIILIGCIVGLVYLRRKRFEAIRGKPIPQEDPDKPGYIGSGHAPSIPPSQAADEPTKQGSLAPSDDPYTMGRIGPDHYQNVPFPDDQGSLAPSSGGAPPPLYKDVRQRDSPPEEDEWRPPMPGRQRVLRAPVDDVSSSGVPPVASPVPSSTGASVNPNPTFI